IQTSASFPIVTNGLPEVWLLLKGDLTVQTSGGPPVDVDHGNTVLLPAQLPEPHVLVPDRATVLRVTLPSPLLGFHAAR
ncbi:MAG: hypothetical protein ACYTGC_11825, partial [Planctomycetota bacterium]